MNALLYFVMVFIVAVSFFINPILFIVMLVVCTLIGGALLNERGQ